MLMKMLKICLPLCLLVVVPVCMAQTSEDEATPPAAQVGIFNPLGGAVQSGQEEEGGRLRNTLRPLLQGTGGWSDQSNGAGGAMGMVAGQLAADLDLNPHWNLIYLGMERYGNGQYAESGHAGEHSLGMLGNYAWRRWVVGVAEAVQYNSTSSYGFSGMEGLSGVNGAVTGIPDPSLPSIQTGLMPNQSVFTSSGGILSGTTTLNASYRLSRRKSVSFSASAGILRPIASSELMRGWQDQFGGEFDDVLTRQTTIAVNYTYGTYTLPKFQRDIRTQTAGVRLQHQLRKRISIEIAGSAQPYTVNEPGFSIDYLGWSGRASGNWTVKRNSFSVAYDRGLTLGSGVMAGAVTSEISGSLSRSLGRTWASSATGGYSTNKDVLGGSHYRAMYFGAGLTHSLTRKISAFANYEVRHQETNVICTTVCPVLGWQNTVGAGISWGPGPIMIH
jgi:hypothetical protein